ncbi:hypothetical protein [Marinobacter sp.]|uniref:tetratricopeptide repeat protein n=1 Tax=Marinobacter sp. TaxID=50741 RepID=UPI00384E8974
MGVTSTVGMMFRALEGISRTGLSLLCGAAITAASGAAGAAESAPERVRDLDYGAVFYEYYQGNAFEALTRLAVAEERGGIEGHGDYPQLVRGGLMLSYGMTREAKAVFEQLLKDNVSGSTRNQAWFYLGKVFYLEGDSQLAQEALGRVDAQLLKDDEPDLFHEWLYLKGQLALATGDRVGMQEILADLPADGLWHAYLTYNLAVRHLSSGQSGKAIDEFSGLVGKLRFPDEDQEDFSERVALRERALLSLGQLHFQQGNYGEARRSLSQISLDSVFSDQALFHLAVAASSEKDHGITLQALNILQERPLFTPWLQQVPYARAFVIEELGEKRQALEAYRQAGEHYEALLASLALQRSELTEQQILAALRPGGPQDPAGSLLELGAADIASDPYGRLAVEPSAFSLANLLATEAFQLALRDLYELYRLSRSLDVWQGQMESFDVMLATRERQRRERIAETRAALAEQQADQWLVRQKKYNERIEQALAEEDHAFFMTAEQMELLATIEAVEARLLILPDDERMAGYRQKIRRIRAYFDWWLAEEYPVNRWEAQKQLRGLNQAMEEFTRRKADIEQEMAEDDRTEALAQRVDGNRQRLETLAAGLDEVVAEARRALVQHVDAELENQQNQVRSYLREARLAQARLSDEIFRNAGGSAQLNSPDTGGQP